MTGRNRRERERVRRLDYNFCSTSSGNAVEQINHRLPVMTRWLLVVQLLETIASGSGGSSVAFPFLS